MGSNVSRHSGKGLSGRRTQSSGNLCNGAKILAPSVGRILNSCGAGGVSNRDRNKFCGSLPNHLDEKEVRSGECTPESLYGVNNNYGEVYIRPSRGKNVELLFHKLVPQQQDFSGGDQGYGSERSPEDELPPPLPTSEPPSRQYSTIRRNGQFPFVTKENTYEARLEKGSRGLGLSVTGGVDTAEKYPGLIRIKRIFPNQPAWECQMLQVGDIILAANGVPLTGLTNYEALEVLRTTPNDVVLKVCRPPSDVFSMPPPSSGEPPPPPRRDPAHVISSSQLNASGMLPLPQLIAEPYEFEIVLKKVNGSLGFMLRKEDESVLGHCVRALVREPALSDGRIRPGDKIVTVNGVDISPMSHEEAVMYLRQCGEEVRLRLYRDPAQTPVSALSPTESYKTFRPKPVLRKEAMDMLCDLAVKKLSPSDSSSSSGRSRLRGSSPGSSPLRRKLKKSPTEDGDDRPQRPNFLDLCGDGSLGRGAEEDADSVLTATSGSEVTRTTVGSATRACVSSDECNSEDGALPAEPASMPPLTSSSSGFSYKNPAYQSAHPVVHSEAESSGERLSDQDIPDRTFDDGGGSHGLLKWKGVLFTPEDDVDVVARDQKPKHSKEALSEDGELVTVELCRGWNSRLGFSLQSSGSGTCISAIYADSVAAKDGRLQPGDRVIMINDENTEDMATSDVIDLCRKIRGSIAITVRRKREDKS
ncbi:UNVERIFIED_CONTAM: hypothetical protein PYX00_002652 [Menopon gallinae]